MAIFFMDSMAHYTSVAEQRTKWAAVDFAVVAGAGAFGAPGSGALGGTGLLQNFAATNTIEVSFYAKNIVTGGSGLWVTLYNSTPSVLFALYVFPDGHLQASDGASWLTGTGTAANVLTFGIHHHIYLKVVISATVGTVDIKVDGVSVLSLTGQNTMRVGAVGVSQIRFTGDGSSGNASSIFSHIALANVSGDITGQPRVEAVFPDGAGFYSQWAPTPAVANWQNVDETTPNDDTDYNADATVGDRDSYTFSNLLGTAATILAVALVPRVRKDDAAARTVKRFVRAGGVNYDGVAVAVPGSYGYLQEVLATNPATGIAWTPAEVNAIECGIKVET